MIENRGNDDNAAPAERLLLQLSSQLQQAQRTHSKSGGNAVADDPKETLRSLSSISSSSLTMSLLAPRLFVPSSLSSSSGEGRLSQSEALAVMGLLISSDPASYLKPASRAVRSYAESNAVQQQQESVEASDEVLTAVVSHLSADDVEASEDAAATLVALSTALDPPFQDRAIRSIASAWRDVVQRGKGGAADEKSRASTISVRCASAVVGLALLGDASMESAVSSGSMDMLLGMVADASDPLLQVSAIDILERMATTMPVHAVRARWLFSHPVLHRLLVLAGGGGHGDEKESAEPDPVLGGPALRALSSLCRLGQRDPAHFALGGSELLTGFHRSLHGFSEHLHGEVDRLAFVDAISSFASSSPDAAACVLDDPVLREGWLTVTVAQPKLKSVILHSVALVIDPPAEKDVSGDTIEDAYVPDNALAMRLFNVLGSVNGRDPTDLVLSAAKSPLVETRLGAYELLRAVAKRGAGVQVLLSCEGFYDFLIEREKETTKEGKEAKFEIVQAVLRSDARVLLADSIVEALKKHVDQGPHYVQTQPWELATE